MVSAQGVSLHETAASFVCWLVCIFKLKLLFHIAFNLANRCENADMPYSHGHVDVW